MATSPSNQPIRSISLPSRPHPIIPQIDVLLASLRSSEVTSTSISQLASLSHKLSNLRELYDCLDGLILLPQNQSKLTQSCNDKHVENLLDGSLRLLDVCGIVKDVMSQVKGHIQGLQSSLRRRSNGELSIGDEVYGYMNMRKKTKMMVKNCLKDVKGVEKRFALKGERKESSINQVGMVDVLMEVEGVTAEIFGSLLDIVSGSKGHSNFKRNASFPFIMCKMIMHHNVISEKQEVGCTNEFEDVDATLTSLIMSQKKKICINIIQAESLRGQMVKLDSSIQDLDEVLEGLFRCLVKTRATLLNVLSQ